MIDIIIIIPISLKNLIITLSPPSPPNKSQCHNQQLAKMKMNNIQFSISTNNNNTNNNNKSHSLANLNYQNNHNHKPNQQYFPKRHYKK